MKYTKHSTYSYNLHVLKTDKFKTVTVKINFKRKLEKDEITKRNLLITTLCESNSIYKTRREMEIATEDLYSLIYKASNYSSGKYNVMGFDVTFLNEAYTEKGMLDKSIKFLADLVFKPKTEIKRTGTMFDEENFKTSYNTLKNNIIMQKENPDNYSKMRMLEEMEKDSCISYRPCGYLEDLKNINSKDLYKYYESVISKDIIDIFVVGNVNESHVRKVIEETFKDIKTLKKPSESHFIVPKKSRLVPRVVKEHQNISQSKLVLGFKYDKMSDFELRYAMNVFTYILGGGPDSKLFKTVREKNSLCYSVAAVSQPLTSTMMIAAGINVANYKKAVSLIKKEISNMKHGKFSDEDIIKAKITYINSMKEIEDSPDGLIGLYSGIEYLNSHTVDQRFVYINKVTRSNVIKVASKVHLDTIYLLEGEDNEER